MSYILDALRRADAERERGAVPSLQSQQHAVGDEEEAAPRSRLLLWAIVALGVALAAALAWNILGAPASSPRQVAEGSVALVPVAPTTVAPVTPATLPSSSDGSAPPTVAPATATAPTALPSASMQPAAPARSPQPAATRPAASADGRRAARRSESSSAVAAARPAAAAGSGPEGHIYAQADLPEEVRRELPRLAIGGASYSGDAASRMVMINGQVFHEGDRLAAGLVLEKIKLRSAVLTYKGWRYELTF
jgi:general secretion pathway protein B